VGFFRGLIAPFRGAAFVVRHGLWGYLVAPLLLNVALVVGTTALALRIVRDRLGTTGFGASPLAVVGLWAVALLLGLAFFVVLQPVVSAPFVDTLTERAERLVRGEAPRQGFFRSLWQALLHGFLKVGCYAFALLLALALAALTGVGAVAGIVVYAIFLAFDGFDYALSRRGVGFGGKWRFLVLHPGLTLGYCLGASLLYLVPLAVVVAPAFAAVGATLAYLDTAPDERPQLPSAINEGKATIP
jgi:uncharacterized protein involved in cysteine biosynthesis